MLQTELITRNRMLYGTAPAVRPPAEMWCHNAGLNRNGTMTRKFLGDSDRLRCCLCSCCW